VCDRQRTSSHELRRHDPRCARDPNAPPMRGGNRKQVKTVNSDHASSRPDETARYSRTRPLPLGGGRSTQNLTSRRSLTMKLYSNRLHLRLNIAYTACPLFDVHNPKRLFFTQAGTESPCAEPMHSGTVGERSSVIFSPLEETSDWATYRGIVSRYPQKVVSLEQRNERDKLLMSPAVMPSRRCTIRNTLLLCAGRK